MNIHPLLILSRVSCYIFQDHSAQYVARVNYDEMQYCARVNNSLFKRRDTKLEKKKTKRREERNDEINETYW